LPINDETWMRHALALADRAEREDDEIPVGAVLVGGFPAGTRDAEYARYFDIGCLTLWPVSRGVFGAMLEPFLADDCMSDDRLAELSACLGSLICVDFSRSDSEPDVIAWLKGARVGKIGLIEREDADGEPYHLSPRIEALIANEV
jgi:hypothetical protein